MASLNDILAGIKGSDNTPAASAAPKYQVQYINISNLVPSTYNFYPITEIEELADAIELAGGILQPLLVRRKAPGHYEIIAGHRRFAAAQYLTTNGKKQYAMLPCHVQDGDDTAAKINLIVTNAQREKSTYTKMQEVIELEKLLNGLAAGPEENRQKFARVTGLQLKDGEAVTARILRKLVAKKTGLSETNVARLKHIDANLQPELQQVLEDGQIGITAADELARLAPEQQKAAAEQIREQIRQGKKTVISKKKSTANKKTKQQLAEQAPVTDDTAGAERIDQPADETLQTSGTDTTVQLAVDYLALYRSAGASVQDWDRMHSRLADFFGRYI